MAKPPIITINKNQFHANKIDTIFWGRARVADQFDAVVLVMGNAIIALGFIGAMNEDKVRTNLCAQLAIMNCPLAQEKINNAMQNPQLCLIGTPFQLRVWQALATLNDITTYSALAQQVHSHPRAVGAAVGANLISYFIPCHLVIGKNGSATGYRWGLDIKNQLLTPQMTQ